MPKANVVSITAGAPPRSANPHTRRSLLTTAALVSIAVTVATIPATVLAAEPDPHAAWLAELEEVIAIQNAPGEAEDDDMPELVWREAELYGLITGTQARTLTGLRAQLAAMAGRLNEGAVVDECEVTLFGNMAATLEQLDGSVPA